MIDCWFLFWIYVVHSISFQTFLYKILNCRRLLKIQYVIAIYLMRWLTSFYNFRFISTATVAIEIHPTKPWLSQLVNFKSAIWTWRHLRRTICNKSLFLNLEKMPQKGMECFRLLFDQLAWINHQFLMWHKRFKEGRESVRDDERFWRSKEVNRPELIGQRVRVRLSILRF